MENVTKHQFSPNPKALHRPGNKQNGKSLVSTAAQEPETATTLTFPATDEGPAIYIFPANSKEIDSWQIKRRPSFDATPVGFIAVNTRFTVDAILEPWLRLRLVDGSYGWCVRERCGIQYLFPFANKHHGHLIPMPQKAMAQVKVSRAKSFIGRVFGKAPSSLTPLPPKVDILPLKRVASGDGAAPVAAAAVIPANSSSDLNSPISPSISQNSSTGTDSSFPTKASSTSANTFIPRTKSTPFAPSSAPTSTPDRGKPPKAFQAFPWQRRRGNAKTYLKILEKRRAELRAEDLESDPLLLLEWVELIHELEIFTRSSATLSPPSESKSGSIGDQIKKKVMRFRKRSGSFRSKKFDQLAGESSISRSASSPGLTRTRSRTCSNLNDTMVPGWMVPPSVVEVDALQRQAATLVPVGSMPSIPPFTAGSTGDGSTDETTNDMEPETSTENGTTVLIAKSKYPSVPSMTTTPLPRSANARTIETYETTQSLVSIPMALSSQQDRSVRAAPVKKCMDANDPSTCKYGSCGELDGARAATVPPAAVNKCMHANDPTTCKYGACGQENNLAEPAVFAPRTPPVAPEATKIAPEMGVRTQSFSPWRAPRKPPTPALRNALQAVAESERDMEELFVSALSALVKPALVKRTWMSTEKIDTENGDSAVAPPAEKGVSGAPPTDEGFISSSNLSAENGQLIN